MKRLSLLTAAMPVALLISILMLGACNAAAPPAAPQATDDGFMEVSTRDIVFKWKVDGNNLEVILRAPTTGWVAVGFDPTSMMRDANFLIGAVVGGEVTISDEYGTSSTGHQSDLDLGGTNDATVLGGEETGGETEINFTIPLDSGDQFDRPLVAGNTYKVLLAYASSDTSTVRHSVRDSVTVEL